VKDLEKSGFGKGWIDGDIGHGTAYQFVTPDNHLIEFLWEIDYYEASESERTILKNRPQKRPNKGIPVRRLDHLNLMSSNVTDRCSRIIKASVQDIVSLLRKMTARLYSISSSLASNPDEVYLTIGAVRYNTHRRDRKGICSGLVAERAGEGDTLPIFIQPNKHFDLPEEDQDIIMVGPGTGIAPSVLSSKNVPSQKQQESHGYSLETSMQHQISFIKTS
jgi:sulfite reductase alpha subunit-like flavoprotein